LEVADEGGAHADQAEGDDKGREVIFAADDLEGMFEGISTQM
jgi:hypothetical protein